MRSKQDGVTLIGWLVILAIIGVFTLAGIRLVPVYMESLKVSSVLRSVKAEHDGNRSTVPKIKQSIRARFQVEDIDIIRHSDIKLTQIANGGYELRATYEHKTQFIGNLGLILDVDHKVEIKR